MTHFSTNVILDCIGQHLSIKHTKKTHLSEFLVIAKQPGTWLFLLRVLPKFGCHKEANNSITGLKIATH